MDFIQLSLIGIGLAMDAFAVSVCKGLNMKKVDYKYTLIIAAFFGGFQALMPLLGWLLGQQFEQYITSVDHWIAFGLLAFIGGNMILESRRSEEVECEEIKVDLKEILMLAIATSIDALAVGVTFAFLKTNIIEAISIIGIITMVLAIIGVLIGNQFGVKYKNKAEFAGGAILVLIGTKILLEHLQVL
ncbi:manganese efflux pump MntP [Velocimicrobium porci]|uniref:Putative manganese efflux pump MntP n=1 Tax=Velocimicrobium porci TaxID=2606634 RepID=A0A6L5XUW4_9FIRM|nr:manganese efflux pump MntP family protein [Velocimicrobium porci]MSS62399.1 manganese efflux pump [Velocimicrobium porci]